MTIPKHHKNSSPQCFKVSRMGGNGVRGTSISMSSMVWISLNKSALRSVAAAVPLIEILRSTKGVSPCLQALGPFPGTSSLVRPQRVNVAPRLIEK